MIWLSEIHAMFSKVVLLIGLSAVVLGAPRVHPKKFSSRKIPDGRIVGGRDADIQEVPHQASLEWYGWHICGALVISETYVLTAGHCTEGSSAEELAIRVGSTIAEEGGQRVRILHIHQHPQYDDYTIDYDISVLHVEPLIFGTNVQPIGLPTGDTELPDGSPVQVSGWGLLYEEADDISYQLQIVGVKTIGLERCRQAYSQEYISTRMLCAGVVGGGKDACSGDSGGPLFADGIAYGIVSWGYGCALVDYPGVYSSIVGLRGYIREITGL